MSSGYVDSVAHPVGAKGAMVPPLWPVKIVQKIWMSRAVADISCFLPPPSPKFLDPLLRFSLFRSTNCEEFSVLHVVKVFNNVAQLLGYSIGLVGDLKSLYKSRCKGLTEQTA